MGIEQSNIDGFDPLGGDTGGSDALAQMLDNARRRDVQNVLKSYTGYFDLFSEAAQNSLDALEKQKAVGENGYVPRIWVYVDIPNSRVRIVDNGCGMDEQEFKFCLRPNVSFKPPIGTRGHKGVGATFLAYGFSFLKLQTRNDGSQIAAILRQGRQWAEDQSGAIPRPKFQQVEFDVPELGQNDSGTCVEIILGGAPGERPRDLGWLGGQTAEQWLGILRVKTPLGGVYLNTPVFQPSISLVVTSSEGTITRIDNFNAEYMYPHHIPNLKVQSLNLIEKALVVTKGDHATKFLKLPNEYKRLDCMYEVWDKDQLLSEDGDFLNSLTEDQRILIERHKVIVYGAFLRSARIWGEYNDDVLKLRKGSRIIHGGLQMASDYMVQGDLSVIPLTSAIGYQNNSHIIVHFTDGNPDLGRKVFQPELKDLADAIAIRAVTVFRRFLQLLKPDTGAQVIAPDKELYDWKKRQEEYRDKFPISLKIGGKSLSMVSSPQQEQDVIALYHQLIGMGLLRGLDFFATSSSDRYDSLFCCNYDDESILFSRDENKLGVSRSLPYPYRSEPKVLEYKYDFDSLVQDFENDVKYSKHIDLVVCWRASKSFKEKFYFNSLLVGDEGTSRHFFGATHQAFPGGGQAVDFEVVILEDLLRFITNPIAEEARQKSEYGS